MRTPPTPGVYSPGQGQLFKIVQAADALGAGFGPGERRQEQPGQNGDDGDDHQQFNQRKRPAQWVSLRLRPSVVQLTCVHLAQMFVSLRARRVKRRGILTGDSAAVNAQMPASFLRTVAPAKPATRQARARSAAKPLCHPGAACKVCVCGHRFSADWRLVTCRGRAPRREQ